MKYTTLGKTGLQVSRITLGCMSYDISGQNWHLNEQAGREFIWKALESGINFFDTANMYSEGESELVLGRALRDFTQRDKVVIATKVYYPMNDYPNGGGLSRKFIFYAVDESLKRLGTDYIDLYQIHRWDYSTPIEETMEALHDLVKMGKVRYLGASSMFAWQFSKALHISDSNGWQRFISMQPQYNLLNREEEREMLPLCKDEGIGVIPWSPLARGLLTRPWKSPSSSDRTKTDMTARILYERFEKADEIIVNSVVKIAQNRGVSCAQVALAWLLQNPIVTSPIIGATKMIHLDDAVAAIDLTLTEDENNFLTNEYIPHSVVGYQ